MGWVSFYQEDHLRSLLDCPASVRPVERLQEVPDRERHGWRSEQVTWSSATPGDSTA
ncbi:hypothetical protein GCM10010483_26110 [Actinokineospora diospyrosa]